MKKNVLVFIAGVVMGIILTFVVSFVISANKKGAGGIDYFEQPVSYENKREASFKVFQVLASNIALANESDTHNSYFGKTVMLIYGNYYTDQIVKIKNPMQIGTYSYKNKGGRSMTVPVIEN